MTVKIVREGLIDFVEQDGGYCATDIRIDGESLQDTIERAVGAKHERFGLESWAAKRVVRARLVLELSWEDKPG